MVNDTAELELPYHGIASLFGVDYSKPSPVDKFCGVILIFCFLFGGTFNSFALAYFSRLQFKTLPDKLYTIISAVDLFTSVVQGPVIFTLLNQRRPFAFTSRTFCGVWIVTFEYLQRVSIYLILLLSVSRTIAIIRPFTIISQKAVLMTLIPYSLLLFSDVVVGLIFFEQAFYYLLDYAYPIKGYNHDKSAQVTPRQISFMYFQNIAHDIEVILPSVIIFISFLLTVVKLLNLPRRVMRPSITVTLFTALFLACNLPYFLALSVMMYLDHSSKDIVVEYPNIGPYIWPVTKVVLVALNATMNPLLYFFRITKFRTWVAAI